MALIDYVLGMIHRDEEGQGLAEYALILALIAIVAIVALIFLGGAGLDHPVDRRHIDLATGPCTGTRAKPGPSGPGFAMSRWRRVAPPNRLPGLDTRTRAGLRFGSPSGGGQLPPQRGTLRGKEVNHPMSFLNALIDLFRTDEEGQGLAEYALILALIAIVAIVALIFLGGQVIDVLSTVGTSI